MTTKLSELLSVFETLWPESGADEWDAVGLAAGSVEQSISKVLFCVDPTLSVLQEAKSKSCQLVVSHHPVLLEGVNSVAEGALKGDILSFAISNSLAMFSAHTNADIVPGGVSDTLAKEIGLEDIRPLAPTSFQSGHGRVGMLQTAVTLEQLAKKIHELLPATSAPIRIAGELTQKISKVALVGGSGAGFIEDAISSGADCFITSDLKHHATLDLVSDQSQKMCLIDVSHYAAESLWLIAAVSELSKLVPGVEFIISEVSTDPWSMSIPGKLS
jgi:dinuclear metal center YbgI/SA1388 family protein